MLGEEQSEQAAGEEGARALGQDVRHQVADGEATGQPEADGDRRVQIGAGHVAERVDQGQHDQAEGQGDADVGYGSVAHVVDHDGARPREHQHERAEQLCRQFSHVSPPARPRSSEQQHTRLRGRQAARCRRFPFADCPASRSPVPSRAVAFPPDPDCRIPRRHSPVKFALPRAPSRSSPWPFPQSPAAPTPPRRSASAATSCRSSRRTASSATARTRRRARRTCGSTSRKARLRSEPVIVPGNSDGAS